ncbi:MAG: RidA family protein [Pseudomonadota bacterium]
MPRTILTPASLSFQPRRTYPYAPGAMAGGMIWTAGQVAWNARAEIVGPGDPAAQTRQALSNIGAILAEGGAGFEDVLRCTVYVTDFRHAEAVRAAYDTFFPGTPPAVTVVHALLAEPEMLVEIEAVARQP